MSAGHATQSLRAPLSERGNDLYQTPPEAVHALLQAEDIPHRIWEPACGPGAIARALRAAGRDVLATDLIDYGWAGQQAHGVDFTQVGPAEAVFDGDRTIVTNPPFKDAQRFVQRALLFSPRVIMLLRLAFLESERRRDILDGGSLARVHVFRNRLPMMHREGWTGKRAASAVAFAWFVWEREHAGPTQLHRISWTGAPPVSVMTTDSLECEGIFG